MLKLKEVNVYYGQAHVLKDLSFEVAEKIAVLIGPNGHGKSTILKTIAGLLETKSGFIHFGSEDVTTLPPDKRVEKGIVFVSQEGNLFSYMSVLENLMLGAYNKEAWKKRDETLRKVFEIFPKLEERKKQIVWTLSGGERKMCMIGRGLMAKPKLLMLDEPSSGLAPKIAESLFQSIREISNTGVTLLLAEQNISYASDIADKFFLIENGTCVFVGNKEEVFNNPAVKAAYLGLE